MNTYKLEVEITLGKTVKIDANSKIEAIAEIEADPSICDFDFNFDKTDLSISYAEDLSYE